MYCCFVCYPFWFNFYSVIAGTISVFLLSLPFSNYVAKSRIGRTLLYVFGSLMPFMNSMHLLIIEGTKSPLLEPLVLWVLLGYLCYVSGILLYAFRFPECLHPGRYDYIGQSHNLWHILVVMGQYFTLIGVMNAFDIIKNMPSCHHGFYY